MSEWKTLPQWAELKLAGMPASQSGVSALAKRSDWKRKGPSKVRCRAGSGIRQYHVSCLPAAAQADFSRRERLAAADAILAGASTDQPVIDDLRLVEFQLELIEQQKSWLLDRKRTLADQVNTLRKAGQ